MTATINDCEVKGTVLDVRKAGVTLNNFKWYPQLEHGSVATAYEPYIEQNVTITPPRTMNALGEYRDICDVEKGEWKWNTRKTSLDSLNWVYYTGASLPLFYADLPLSIRGTDVSETGIISDYYHVSHEQASKSFIFVDVEGLEGKTITVSQSNGVIPYGHFTDADRVSFGNLPHVNTYTVPAGAKYFVPRIIMASNKNGVTERIKVQVEVGSISTEYTSYESPVFCNITPPKPLNAIGDYYDKADIEKGVWAYATNIAKISEASTVKTSVDPKWHDENSYSYECSNFKVPFEDNGVISGISSHFAGYKFSGFYSKAIRNGFMSSQSYIVVNVPIESGVDTVAKFKQWAEENDVRFLKKIKDIITEPIAEADLEFLRSLELLTADHYITVTDQDGNDVPWLTEYIRKLSEVAS